MEAQEFIKKIEAGQAKLLTLKDAKKLKGKTIIWMYFGYIHNTNQVYETTIGDVVKDTHEERLIILDPDGKYTYMYCEGDTFFDEPTFVCSDSDRPVYYFVK